MQKQFLAFTFLLLILTGCTMETDNAENDQLMEVEVLSVIDGDTIRIDYEGESTTVRYLLIDTPETNHPRLGEQPIGKEAAEANRELLASGTVAIEFDEGDRFDDYDRLLAYLYVDGESVQEQLLEQGLARVAYVFEPNTRYIDEFTEAEQQARDESLGIWQYDGYATGRGFNSDAYGGSISRKTEDSGECPIKGNINRKGDKIYHLPSDSSYDRTNPEQWFCSEQEALDAGFRGVGG